MHFERLHESSSKMTALLCCRVMLFIVLSDDGCLTQVNDMNHMPRAGQRRERRD